MREYLRHRYAVFLPFALLALVTLVGGAVWSVDARGRVVDDASGEPVAEIVVSYGSRSTLSGPDGSYELRGLPRGARVSAQARGYSRSSAPAEATELRLLPLTLTFEVKEEGAAPPKGVPNPEARQQGKAVGRGTKDGSMVVAPYPARGVPVLLCAEGFESREVTPKGVLMELTMKRKEGGACPPLPSPSPAASPALSPTPLSPSPSPSPSPR